MSVCVGENVGSQNICKKGSFLSPMGLDVYVCLYMYV